MVRKAAQLVGLRPDETSGVDHPAHLHEGWLVMKSQSGTSDRGIPAHLIKEAAVPDASTNDQGQQVADLAKQVAELVTKNAELQAALDAATPATEPTEDEVLKAAPAGVRAIIEKAKADAKDAVEKAAALEAEVAKARDAAADLVAIEKAAPYKALGLDPSTIGVALRKMTGVDSEAADAIHVALTAATNRDAASGIFKEVGVNGQASGGSAYSQMTNIAKSMVAAGTAKTVEAAIAGMVDTHPDLMSQYFEEKGA